ncbi:unnamed protein product, partial [Allacma fusca]
IDSSKQPPGYAYTDNFSDPIIKSVESPDSPRTTTSSQFTVSGMTSCSSSSNDFTEVKQSSSGYSSSEGPTAVGSEVNTSNNNQAENSTLTSSPVQPLASPSIEKTGQASLEVFSNLFEKCLIQENASAEPALGSSLPENVDTGLLEGSTHNTFVLIKAKLTELFRLRQMGETVNNEMEIVLKDWLETNQHLGRD